MIETREKIIDGSIYSVTQLPARRALKLKAKLMKIIGPLFLEANSSNFHSVCHLIDENQFETLCMEMIQGVRKDGVELTPPTFDLEFAGDMAGVYKMLLFVVETNYSNFFSMLDIGLPSFQDEQTNQASTKKIFTSR